MKRDNTLFFPEHLKIESAENTDENLVATLQDIPDLSCLSSSVKSVHVKDPFLQETGNLLSEDTLFG